MREQSSTFFSVFSGKGLFCNQAVILKIISILFFYVQWPVSECSGGNMKVLSSLLVIWTLNIVSGAPLVALKGPPLTPAILTTKGGKGAVPAVCF